MCWSADVSLKTFLFSAFVFLFALLSGTFKPIILFSYLSFFLIQLIEYFLWKNLNNKKWNEFFSLMAFMLLLIHPMMLTLIITNPETRQYFLYIYLIFLSLMLYMYTTNSKHIYSVSVAKNGHLIWNWTKYYNYVFYLYFVFFFALIIEKEYIVFIVILLTFMYSLYSYYSYNTFTSMWCWTANIIGIYIIIRIIASKVNTPLLRKIK